MHQQVAGVRMVRGIGLAIVLAGCGGRTSALLLERRATGPIVEAPSVSQPVAWRLEPATRTQENAQIEATVTYATSDYLRKLFSNKTIFGRYYHFMAGW